MHAVNNVRFETPYRLLVIAVSFGMIADGLLRVTPWGLNLLLAVACALAASVTLTCWSAIDMTGEGRWLVPAIVFFAAALVWRDSPTLTTANACALLVSVTLAALSARAGQLRLAGVSQYLLGTLYVVMYALAGLLPTLTREVPWRQVATARVGGTALAATRGLAIAIPPLIVFSVLLAAADANFERLLADFLDVDMGEFMVRALLIATYAWLCGGVLREMLLAPLRPRVWSEVPRGLTIGAIELSIVLGLIDLLFLTFVMLQLPYLFGGRVQVSSMGYSEYARRGFFELVWVAGLSLPLLLLLHWLVPKTAPRTARVFGVLAAAMVALLLVIEASAIQRMQIYVADTGLTELRLQASAFMAWLCLVLVWFLATVLRGYPNRFAFGALVSAFVLIGMLDVVNPDAVIVRTNATYGHLFDSGRLDERPLASLSADATPALVEALPLLPEPDRAQVTARLLKKHSTAQADWRTFNLSRWQAAAALAPLH
jgi:hypothetical protein